MGVVKSVPWRLSASIVELISNDLLNIPQEFRITNGVREKEQERTRKEKGSNREGARKEQSREETATIKEVTGKEPARMGNYQERM